VHYRQTEISSYAYAAWAGCLGCWTDKRFDSGQPSARRSCAVLRSSIWEPTTVNPGTAPRRPFTAVELARAVPRLCKRRSNAGTGERWVWSALKHVNWHSVTMTSPPARRAYHQHVIARSDFTRHVGEVITMTPKVAGCQCLNKTNPGGDDDALRQTAARDPSNSRFPPMRLWTWWWCRTSPMHAHAQSVIFFGAGLDW